MTLEDLKKIKAELYGITGQIQLVQDMIKTEEEKGGETKK